MFACASRRAVGCAEGRLFSTSVIRNADFTHAVVGGGVVGLAIARKLQARDGASTVLVEKHGTVGTETSSRNSEVIHAGLYYGETSLKTKLCLRGKEMMYELCRKNDIPHMNCGKWIVAQDEQQMEALEKVHSFASTIGVPTHFVSSEEAKQREPDVRAEAGVLESTSTGIVDSHSLMQYLEGDFEESGGMCAFNAEVTAVEPIQSGSGGWKITTVSGGEESSITAETLINSAGLAAIPISNMILPSDRHLKPYYAKGSYFSYSLSRPKPSILVYPAPIPGHGGLGTHLTLDMAGRIRFGPDVEWVDDPMDLRVNDKNLTTAIDDIQSYLPGIDRDAIGLDYAGIRPKLGKMGAVASGKGFQDFYIKTEEGFENFVNLLGIESPGLTSSLAIAEMVERLLYK
ncbi:FAD dependent oxidoreductase [Lophium mytilinum]|uniref:L-2-hydroxyglutarate dehydrogenase, mitochondrial n=1 Tax=Lophium mytilinum TaxID=390894 RepID=A0A6A6RHE4_9PEZI|nr:FAD dependent oxidoreductase [Lophium mytilinum]